MRSELSIIFAQTEYTSPILMRWFRRRLSFFAGVKDDDVEEEHGQQEQAPQNSDDEEEIDEYEVEKVTDRRARGPNQVVEYQLKWKGYSTLSWEKEENLTHCIDMLREYEKKRTQRVGNDGAGTSKSASSTRKTPVRQTPVRQPKVATQVK